MKDFEIWCVRQLERSVEGCNQEVVGLTITEMTNKWLILIEVVIKLNFVVYRLLFIV
jgi:hypothetical protein